MPKQMLIMYIITDISAINYKVFNCLTYFNYYLIYFIIPSYIFFNLWMFYTVIKFYAIDNILCNYKNPKNETSSTK